jgi:hypothetical protein
VTGTYRVSRDGVPHVFTAPTDRDALTRLYHGYGNWAAGTLYGPDGRPIWAGAREDLAAQLAGAWWQP